MYHIRQRIISSAYYTINVSHHKRIITYVYHIISVSFHQRCCHRNNENHYCPEGVRRSLHKLI